jgi:hypothetical protein
MPKGDENDRLAKRLNELATAFRELSASQTPTAKAERAAIKGEFLADLLPRLEKSARAKAWKDGVQREWEDLRQGAWIDLNEKAEKILLYADDVLALSMTVAKRHMIRHPYGPPLLPEDYDIDSQVGTLSLNPDEFSVGLSLLTSAHVAGKQICIFHPTGNDNAHRIVLDELKRAGKHGYSMSPRELKERIRLQAQLGERNTTLRRRYIVCTFWFAFLVTEDEGAARELAHMVVATTEGRLNHDRCSPTNAAIRMWRDSEHPELKKLIKENLAAQVARGEIDDLARMSLENWLENGSLDDR